MANKANEVIENLIRQIESGTPPWRCGWEKSGSGLPTNATTGREYTGMFQSLLYWISHCGLEELVAEMSCAITKARIGLEGEVLNHASYLESWLKVLKKNPGYLMTAASAASKSSDYLVKQEV